MKNYEENTQGNHESFEEKERKQLPLRIKLLLISIGIILTLGLAFAFLKKGTDLYIIAILSTGISIILTIIEYFLSKNAFIQKYSLLFQRKGILFYLKNIGVVYMLTLAVLAFVGVNIEEGYIRILFLAIPLYSFVSMTNVYADRLKSKGKFYSDITLGLAVKILGSILILSLF